jgi:hypothetical protein
MLMKNGWSGWFYLGNLFTVEAVDQKEQIK